MQTILKRERIAKQICSELNQFVDLKSTLISIISHIKDLCNVKAVAIRLHSKNDYPYYVYDGFPESFIQNENSLISKDKHGNYISNNESDGYLLDCLCGNVIEGKTNPEFYFFTKGGSFWSNNSTVLLRSTPEEDLPANTRNFCNACGYESVALIPIKNKTGIIGLIQLNDKQISTFNKELINFLEMIGEQIGIAVESAMIYEDLQVNKKQLEETLKQLHQTQNQLIEAKKLASLGQLVAGISHEMNTPLSNALMGIHTLYDNTKDFINNPDTKCKQDPELMNLFSINTDLADIVLRNVERATKLARNFKNASVSIFDIKKEKFSLYDFLNDIVNSIKPTFNDKNINFVLKCDNDIRIVSYPFSFFQIFTNLIMNSYIHGFENKENGTVTIECIEDIKSYRIEYSDDGIGISHENLTKIFEPFYTSKKSTFSGLGLSIIHNLVTNQLNGIIECSSKPNSGVLFIINIPKS